MHTFLIKEKEWVAFPEGECKKRTEKFSQHRRTKKEGGLFTSIGKEPTPAKKEGGGGKKGTHSSHRCNIPNQHHGPKEGKDKGLSWNQKEGGERSQCQ